MSVSAGNEELDEMLRDIGSAVDGLLCGSDLQQPAARELLNSSRDRIRSLFAEREAALKTAERALERAGFRKSCDIPACNCGDQWGHGGYASERLHEISEATWEALGTERANGRTILDQVHLMALDMKEREAQVAALGEFLLVDCLVCGGRGLLYLDNDPQPCSGCGGGGRVPINKEADRLLHDTATVAREYTARVRAEGYADAKRWALLRLTGVDYGCGGRCRCAIDAALHD